MSSARLMLVSVLFAALTACGGGGGSVSTGSGSSVTPPTTPVTPVNNMAQQSVQRADVQTSISGIQAVREYTGGSTTAFARAAKVMKAAVARARMTGFAASAPGCSNGQTSSTVAGPNGSEILTVSSYYDALCTEIQSTIIFTASSTGNNITGPMTLTTYTTSGAVVLNASGQMVFAYNSLQQLTGLSILFSSILDNGKNLGQLAVGCSAASAAAVTCGVAVAADVPAASVMDGANVNMTIAAGTTTTSFSVQATSYQGAPDSLTIAASTFPLWTITPNSSQIGTISMTGTQTGSAVSLTATDSANGGSVTMTGTATAMSGTVVRTDTNATVANFTLDGSGDGTLTYGNGTTAPIVNYAVQG